MNVPNPLPTNGTASAMAAAGNASAFGGACAVVWIVTQHLKGIDYPAGYESAIAVIISTLFIYARALLEKFTGTKLP